MDEAVPDAARTRFERLGDLFQRARRLPEGERAAFLASECPDVEGLRAEVVALLASDARLRDAPAPAVPGLEDAVARAGAQVGLVAGAPERIARYRILRVIGEGGMGTVYEAEEQEPPRRVALKVIRRDVLSAEATRRFEIEARVLARLDHPGIAKVYAVGAGDAHGEPPWIAMELVEGRSLFEHATRERLDDAARVGLVARVADAVAHAHSRGVVHRDVKPSNVLVDASGQPRVLDFGVARLVGPDSGLSTAHTAFGRILGTVAYMSPEQASGEPDAVDERSDVYALGVVAFELLAGRTPHELGTLPLPLALQRLTRDDPPTLGTVRRDLRGDLSVVIAKATAREPGRRYATAATFAEDLRRFLRYEPVSARPPTAGYYARKFLRRHRALVGGTLVAFLALATGLVLALLARAEEETERRRADRAAYRAELAGAAAAWRGRDPQTARRRLSLVPAERRGWEWRHLAAELERRRGPLLPATERRRVVLTTISLVEFALDPRVAGTLAASVDGRLAVFAARSGGGEKVSAWIARREGGAPRAVGDGARAVVSAAVSPRGDRVALGQDEGTVRVVDAGTGAELARARLHGNAVLAVAFDPDGVRVASGSEDRTLCVWDPARTPDSARRVRGFREGLRAVAWSDDGGRVAGADAAGEVLVVEAAGDEEPLVLDAEELGEIEDVSFAERGRVVVAASRRGRLELDASPADRLRVLRSHAGINEGNPFPYVYGVAVSPKGDRVASGGWDTTVRVHDVVTGALLLTCSCGEPVFAVAYSPSGDRIAATCVGGFLRVFDASTGERVLERSGLAPRQAQPLAWSPDGERLLVVGPDARVVELSAKTLETVATTAIVGTSGAAAYSPDGNRIASIDGDGVLEVARRGGAPGSAQRVRAHRGFGTSAAFSPDGKRIVTTGEDGNVVVRDAESLEPLATFTGHRFRSFSAAFFPDGTRVVSGGNDGTLRILDPATGDELLVLEGHQAYVYSVAISPDGETVFSASGDNTVRLWSALPYAERLLRANAAPRPR